MKTFLNCAASPLTLLGLLALLQPCIAVPISSGTNTNAVESAFDAAASSMAEAPSTNEEEVQSLDRRLNRTDNPLYSDEVSKALETPPDDDESPLDYPHL